MQTFTVSTAKDTIYVTGQLGSLSAPEFSRAMGQIGLPSGGVRIDFTSCTLFSTACFPALQEFISRCKQSGHAVTCITGDALRRTIALVNVPLGIKRIDPEEI